MCAWFGKQWSCGVVTARVQTDAVWSFHHSRWDLHQSTYPIPLGRSGLTLLSRCVATKSWAEPPQTMANRTLDPLGLGSGPLAPYVKYTTVGMMILTFGQLHFVIPWTALIWYLSSWNQINTKIVELGSKQGEYMVIPYIYSTCWCIKSMFDERQQCHGNHW
jgi:hypothetical protein